MLASASTALFTSPGRTQILGQLMEGTHTELPPSEALSYVWGPKGQDRDSIINDKSTSSRSPRNDVTSYREDRESFHCTPGPLWLEYTMRILRTDQICISQANIDGPGQQVSMMDRMCHHTVRPLFWQGLSNARTESCPTSIPMLLHAILSKAFGLEDKDTNEEVPGLRR